MNTRMGRALARAGAGGVLAAMAAVLTAGVVAAGPQGSSAAPTSTTAAVQPHGSPPAQVVRPTTSVPVTTAPRTPTRPVVKPAAPARRPAATRRATPSPPRPVTPTTVIRQWTPLTLPPTAAAAAAPAVGPPAQPAAPPVSPPAQPAVPPVSPPARPAASPPARPGTFPLEAVGFDISQYQCGHIPSAPAAVSVVQVTGGALNNPPNPCYVQEAAWAGSNLSAYIYLDGLPNPAPPEAKRGPASRCARTSPICQAYDFGFNWARHWVAYSRHQRLNPQLWWLDVEPGAGWTSLAVNDGVIRGAADGLRSQGVSMGIYSTPYQWAAIAGDLSFPGVPLWIPGAGNLSGPGFTATAYCRAGQSFAGGHLTWVQWGYTGDFPGAYQGPASPYDLDYACPGVGATAQ